jgi:hypothetical protein
VDSRRRRFSWLASASLHGLGIAAVGCELLFVLALAVPQAPATQVVELTGQLDRDADERAPALATLPVQIGDDPTARAVADEHIAYLAAAAVPPELERQLIDGGDSADQSVAASWVQQRVADEIAAAENLSADDQLQTLRQLAGTLNRVSSAESVDAIASRLQTLLGTESRAREPAAEPVAGEFDLDTAQLHDVRRSDNGRGGFSYVGVMLDAAGRTMETPLDEAEGANLYRIFELMKSNPLLERVYRGVVMSLLDKMLKPAVASGPPPMADPLPAP